jgi:D-alanine-D-alanine ligase
MNAPHPSTFGKVAVLMGGTSAEREVSLMSGNGVLAALQSCGVDAHGFDTAFRPLDELTTAGFKRCFIALHGRHGEDGCVQGALELMGIPYTGSGIMASSIAMDKTMTKRVWLSHGLPTPRYVALQADEQQPEKIKAALQTLGLPLIVKPPHEGSSIGVSKVSSPAQLEAAIALSLTSDPELLLEEFITGVEITCPILGTGSSAIALPIIRIAAPDGAYDYHNKYFTDTVKYHCPSGLPELLEKQIQATVLQSYRALGCRGWGRADLMIRHTDQQPYLLEMNTSPGMTSHSLVPKSALAAGITYEQLCLQLLASATLDSPRLQIAPPTRHSN